MQAVSGLFGGKPKVDTSAQRRQEELLAKQEKQQAEEKKSLQQRQTASLNATRARRAGYKSLVTFGETGVGAPREQLG